jgi:hypothetical protein
MVSQLSPIVGKPRESQPKEHSSVLSRQQHTEENAASKRLSVARQRSNINKTKRGITG